MAVGLDIGTAFIISARDDKIKKQRNAFLTIDEESRKVKKQLSRLNIPYVELHGRVHIVGKHAFEYAQIFGSKDLRRPMRDGLLNPSEKDGFPILQEIIKGLIGKPVHEGEVCSYSVPAEPIDQESLVDYHKDVISQILESLGYTPTPVQEAVALAYHGLVDNELTGIAMSLGAGMANVAVMYAGMPTVDFSVARGGDFIDINVSRDTDVPTAKVQKIKEEGNINIGNAKLKFTGGNPEVDEFVPETQVEQAIKSYYSVLITYIIKNINTQFQSSQDVPNFPNSVPIICGGGTSLIPGFVEMFQEQLEKQRFPIEVREITLAENTHEAVALGCLNEALLDEEEADGNKE